MVKIGQKKYAFTGGADVDVNQNSTIDELTLNNWRVILMTQLDGDCATGKLGYLNGYKDDKMVETGELVETKWNHNERTGGHNHMYIGIQEGYALKRQVILEIVEI